MQDIREILESTELADAVKAVEVLLAKRELPRKAVGQKTFSEIALGRTFNARDALSLIGTSSSTYPGLREVVSAGFVGWVLFPNDAELRTGLMMQAVLEHMNDAERAVGLVEAPIDLPRDIVARYVITGIDFLTDVYDKLGGYEAFTRSAGAEIMAVLIGIHSKSINTTVRALTYLHHGADRYEDPEFDFAPSLNRAATVLFELKKSQGPTAYSSKYVSRSLLHRRWSSTKPTLALLYSASTIRVKRTTLLSIMLDGSFTYAEHHKFHEEWLGRARYVADHVFSKMENDLQRTTMKLVGDIPPKAFNAPTLDALEQGIMSAQFRKKFRKSAS